MLLEIAKTIHENRKSMSITQEQLANMLGVSPGAVSKWENGVSVPDIALLKPMARVFNTTVDALLSFRRELSEKELEEIKLDLNETFMEEGCSAGEAKGKELIREYPNSNALKLIVAGLIELYGIKWDNNAASVWKGNENPETANRIEAILSLHQDVVDNGDTMYKLPALHALARIYLISGETEKSKRALAEIPTDNPDPLLMMSALWALEGNYEKADEICKRALYSHLNQSVAAIQSLAHFCIESGDTERQKQYLMAMSMLQNTFGLKIDMASLSLAKQYLSENNNEQAANWLLKYVEGLKGSVANENRNIFFNGIEEYENATERLEEIEALLLALKKDNDFNSLGELENYKKAFSLLQE